MQSFQDWKNKKQCLIAKVHQLQQQQKALEVQVRQKSRECAKKLSQSVLKEAFKQKDQVYAIKDRGELNFVTEE